MALIGSSGTTTAQNGLSATYLNTIIKETINAGRKPINTLSSQKNQLGVKKAIYNDLKNKLLTFKGVMEDLTSDHSDTVFDNMKTISSDTGVLTASATSEAINGSYTISVNNLAESHMVHSDQQASSSEALGFSGTFTINDVSIDITTEDSLADIVEAINMAEYEDGEEVTATIVDNYLILESSSTGVSNSIIASDDTGDVLSSLGVLDGGNFKNTLQEAEDASFTVNGISITRSSNTEIDDVIQGVTLDLKGEGTDIELDVSTNYTDIQVKIAAFKNNLNDVIGYLGAKLKTTINEKNNTYTRGALAGETVFSRLRMDLIGALRTHVTASVEGDPQYLEDIGLTVGSGLSINLDESTLLSTLESNFDGVVNLFDQVMDNFLNILEPFTTQSSSSNTLDVYINSVDTKIDSIDTKIEGIEKSLQYKQDLLIKQYSSLYLQNINFTQQQYSLLGIYSNLNISG
ncbi:flagellar filament capping protein FliD [Candidatus Poribacteria bacterium]|nr:flagellar filament capping protein FliD [Candidatus Poribacteria bacterium]